MQKEEKRLHFKSDTFFIVARFSKGCGAAGGAPIGRYPYIRRYPDIRRSKLPDATGALRSQPGMNTAASLYKAVVFPLAYHRHLNGETLLVPTNTVVVIYPRGWSPPNLGRSKSDSTLVIDRIANKSKARHIITVKSELHKERKRYVITIRARVKLKAPENEALTVVTSLTLTRCI